MAALPEVPAQTQLPFAELIYPMPGTRHASTLVYRAGERVFKIALDAAAAARLAREARFLAGPLLGYACFADVYRLGSVRDARLSAEPLACLSEQYIAGLPADAWVERHAQGLEPGSVAHERIVGALYGCSRRSPLFIAPGLSIATSTRETSWSTMPAPCI